MNKSIFLVCGLLASCAVNAVSSTYREVEPKEPEGRPVKISSPQDLQTLTTKGLVLQGQANYEGPCFMRSGRGVFIPPLPKMM